MPEKDLLVDPLLKAVPVHEGYKVLGGVVLYQKLGQGGMGAVYKGRHLRLDVDVAVKVMVPPPGLDPESVDNFVRRFIREAQTAASISHTNLVRVIDVNTEGGAHYLVMDFVDGGSAGERLGRKGRLSEQEAVEIVLGAAEGLAEAHREGIVHRDVKPDNIMIDKRGRVRVADLGLAKAFSADSDTGPSMLTQTQTAMGTPYFMSPEQFVSARTVGPPADVWSLGVTLFQLLTAKLPWADSSAYAVAFKVTNDPLPDPRALCADLSDGVCGIMSKSLHKKPEDRYADCTDMAAALRAHLDSIRTSPGSVLPDALAGTTKLALATVTPPERKTMTLIAEAEMRDEAVPDVGVPGRAGADLAGRPGSAQAALRKSATSATVPAAAVAAGTGGRRGTIALLLLLLLGAGAVGGYFALRKSPHERDDRAQQHAAGVAARDDSSGREAIAEARAAAVHLKAARSLREAGLLDKARGEVAEALKLAPDHADARKLLDEIQGEIAVKQSTEKVRAKADAHSGAARSLREAGLLDKARDEAAEALKLVPDHAGAKELLHEIQSEMAREQSKAERAAAYKKWMDQGLRLRLAGKLKEAATAYERARASAPAGSAEAAKAAVECLHEHFRAQADDARAKGDLKGAIELYSRALSQKDDAGTRSRLDEVKAKIEEKRAEDARRAEAARMRAAHKNAMDRARSLMRGRQWKDAAAALKGVLRRSPGDAEAAKLLAEAEEHLGPAPTLTLDLGGGVRMQLVHVRAGRFKMGSKSGENDERPRRQVSITSGFYLGKHEVTQAEYQRVMGTNPSRSKGADKPVEMVTWVSAAEFCRKLSRQTGRAIRLPTEAEWEYACRAGSDGKYCFGDTTSGLGSYAWYRGNSRRKSHPAGAKRANAWGLHDMYGNVSEWCADVYASGYYASSPREDPAGPNGGKLRVFRGGSYSSHSNNCRSADRNGGKPTDKNYNLGFRVVAGGSVPGR